MGNTTEQRPFEAPLLLNRYQPVELLARGSSALVFRARDEVLGRNVAIKHFNNFSPEAIDEFRAEVRTLARLSHHGIVSILDVGLDESSEAEPHPFLVMEYVQGKSVRETLEERSLPASEIGELGFEVVEALEYIHAQGVVHRDITPSNIMLVSYGTPLSRTRARVTDFGIAISVGTRHEPGTPAVGTPAYFSPEQAAGVPLTTASDIYSLGLVLLECFTRRRAFPGEAIESAKSRLKADPDIPDDIPEVWQVILRGMTNRDPRERPNAGSLARDIRMALRHGGRHI